MYSSPSRQMAEGEYRGGQVNYKPEVEKPKWKSSKRIVEGSGPQMKVMKL